MSLTISLVCAAVITVFILAIKLYKNFIQKILLYEKKLGKVNSLFAKLFKLSSSPLNAIYIEFYQSLSLWQKMSFAFRKKTIHIDSSAIINDSGIYLKLLSNEFRMYINPCTLVNSGSKETDISYLLSKFFRGNISLITVNIMNRSQKNTLIDLINPISVCFGYIARYLSSSFKYVVNITEVENNISYQVWDEYRILVKINKFWPDEKPSSSWFNMITNKYTDNQLSIGNYELSSEQVKNLYCFIHNCLTIENFINLLQARVSVKVAKYNGFGINIIPNKEMLNLYCNHKFTKKITRFICVTSIIFLTIGLIIGWYQIKDTFNKTALVNQQISINDINLKNYYETSNIYFGHNRVSNLVYYNGIKIKLDKSWKLLIENKVIQEVFKNTTDYGQKLALNIAVSEINHPSTKNHIANNIWLWSKVTNIPEHVLSVWLKIKHTESNKKINNEAFFDNKNQTEIISNIDVFIKNIFSKSSPLKLSLDKSIIDEALKLKLFNKILADKNSGISVMLLKVNINTSLSDDDRIILNRFITYLELRDLILSVTKSKSITEISNSLIEMKDRIEPMMITLWDKKLASFLLQSISNKFYSRLDNITKNKNNYNYAYYKKHIQPLNLKIIEIVDKYKRIGINIGSISDQFRLSLNKYLLNYNNFYYKVLVDALEVDSKNIDLLILRLEEINNSLNIEPILSSIHKNILDVENPRFLELSLKGFNIFYEDSKSYYLLISKYIDILNKVKNNPKNMIDLYQDNKHPFLESMDDYLKNVKVSHRLKKLLIQSAISSEIVTSGMLQQSIQKYWSDLLEPIYENIFNSFPFKKNTNDQISILYLTKMVGNNGLFWHFYFENSILIKNYESDHWLTYNQFKQYQKMTKLHKTLWDVKGQPKAIEFMLTTSELLANYRDIKKYWFFFHKEQSYYYNGILSVGENRIWNIGAGNIEQKFKIKWWLNTISSVALVNNKKDLRDQKTKEGAWSFWQLLKLADQNNNTFIWNFNNSKTQILFDIKYSDIWFN
jgi:hypothetical protein